MKKNVLRTFAISVVFLGLQEITLSQKAMTMLTEEFEQSMSYGGKHALMNWVCRKKRIPSVTTHSYASADCEVETHRSYTPVGTIIHTEKRKIPIVVSHKNKDKFECSMCGRSMKEDENPIPPSVTFRLEGGTKVMVLTWPQKKVNYQACGKMFISQELQFLWDKARLNEEPETSFAEVLNRLWNAAKEEDSKSAPISTGLPDCVDETTPLNETERYVTYKYEQPSNCCCAII